MAFDEHYSDSQLAKRATRTASMTSAELPPPDVSLPVLEDIVEHHTASVQLFRGRRRKRQALDDAFAQRRMAKGVRVYMEATLEDIQFIRLVSVYVGVFDITFLTVRHAVVLGQTLLRSIRVHRKDAHLQSVHLPRLQRLRVPQDDAHLQLLPLRRLRARTYNLLDMSLCMCAGFPFFYHTALYTFEADSVAQNPPLPRRRSLAMRPFAEVTREHIICYTCLCVCTRVILHLCECSLCVSSCTFRFARVFQSPSSPRQWRCSVLLMQFLNKLLLLQVLPRRSSRFTFARVEYMIGSSWWVCVFIDLSCCCFWKQLYISSFLLFWMSIVSIVFLFMRWWPWSRHVSLYMRMFDIIPFYHTAF